MSRGIPLAPGEHPVSRLRPHLRALVVPVIALALVAGAVSYLVGVLPQQWMVIGALAVAAIVVVVGILPPFAAWGSRDWIVTTRRLVARWGVLTRHRDELVLGPHCRVTVRRSPAQRLLGSGDVIVDPDGARALVLSDVPAPALVQAALVELCSDRR